MNKAKKYFYITLGFIALGLGLIGVILPILPTTPFLLVTSFCFAKGSERFHTWFTNTNIYKKHLESFVKERAMTLKQKVVLLSFVNFMLAFPLILVDVLPMRITIIVLIIIKLYYFVFKVKTITPEEKRAMEAARREMA
ncbi:YbaN family protein [Clostridium saudiense]|uniref:YbaN family protein n=1 Tax=Clostridium saudiense TaxID=1414720 RepID=A0ABS2FHS8_9CLOT|nr:YbaN family protein [Clostridium saudiense]MBM6819592.1 YbaN family protein [Clostridium saudiense]